METFKIFLMVLVQIGWFFAAFGLTYYIGKRIQRRKQEEAANAKVSNR